MDLTDNLGLDGRLDGLDGRLDEHDGLLGMAMKRIFLEIFVAMD